MMARLRPAAILEAVSALTRSDDYNAATFALDHVGGPRAKSLSMTFSQFSSGISGLLIVSPARSGSGARIYFQIPSSLDCAARLRTRFVSRPEDL